MMNPFRWTVLLFSVPALFGNPTQMDVTRRGSYLEIAARMPADITEVELRIESGRNNRISRISDVSPLAPPTREATPQFPRDIWYPIVDVRIQPGMEGIAVYSSVPAKCQVNQNFYKSQPGCGKETILGGDRLVEWENTILAEPRTADLKQFYLRVKVPVIHGRLHHRLELLSRQWKGRLSLHADSREVVSVQSVFEADAPASSRPGDPLARARLIDSVAATAAYLIRSQNRNPMSPTYGGLYLFYDLDAASYRSTYWIWGWGPAVRMLLEANEIEEVARRFPPGRLKAVAEEIGRASLRFIVEDENHPARGVPVSRWNRSLAFETGFEERVSIADGQFLAGWAWMPLYRATGDKAFLDATRTLADATERLSREFGVIPQDYYQEPRVWSAHILDESGFGTEGLAELYLTTKDARYQEVARRYLDRIREKLERPDGLWERGWNRDSGVMPAQYITRGMGWAMEGLLAAHRAMPGDGYLQRAIKMAEHLMQWQHQDGSWSFQANRPVSEVGIGEKATALWSLLFYQLHQSTGDTRHLNAARKALRWGVENQYSGTDPEARGGIVGVNPQSAVGYRHWFRVSCAYTSGFFGLAAIEELRRQN